MQKCTILLCSFFLFCFSSINVSAQKKISKSKKTTKHQGWDAGLLAGITYYNGELHCPDKGFSNIRPGGGIYVRYALNDNFFTRANFQFGQVEGRDDVFEEDWRLARDFTFNSFFYDGGLMLEWEPFAKYRYSGVKRFQRMLSPYLHLGVGGTYSKPNTDFNEPNAIARPADIARDKANNSFFHFAVPFGGGIRYDLNENWMLGLEGGVRFLLTDYLDGISYAGNPGKRDWFETANLTIGYRFPFKKDKDGDGIIDELDTCPDDAGTSKTKGCPDKDGDGVADKNDNCPNEPGTPKTFGCPDTDSDGIVDKEDECPQEKGSETNKGCPDRDEDGVVDKDDKCPDEQGAVADNGCPVIDVDKDGVPDKEDECPEIAGLASMKGCPDSTAVALRDSLTSKNTTLTTPTIGDAPKNSATSPKTAGVVSSTSKTASEASKLADLPVSEVVIVDENTKAKNPSKKTKKKTVKKAKANSEITDSNSTKAPSYNTSAGSNYSESTNIGVLTAGAVVEKGAAADNSTPTELSEADLAILKEATYGVFFDPNKANLKSESYTTLSKVAAIIKKYPNYILRITGHTDNQGEDLANVKLSVARARAIYNYFLKKGIDVKQIWYRGCGDGNPVAENENEEGRAKNRRVDFDMMTP
jgi:OmpA-OmpF porin, OOP family